VRLLRSLEWPGLERVATAAAVVRRDVDSPQFRVGHGLYVRATTERAGEGHDPHVPAL
jgi:hypothetical protein